MGIANTIIGTGLGMATAGWQDKRQLEQAKKLQEQQIKGAKEMGKYNQGLALDTWEKTNYAAQRKQMEKAGLNVGLMYGGNGGGGTTSGGQATMPSGQATMPASGPVGMGMQLGLQTQMQQAQIENIQAQTEKTKTETEKLGGVDTEESKTRIENLKQSTTNAKVQEGIMQYQKDIAQIDASIKDKTQNELIQNIININTKLAAEIQSAEATAFKDQATKETMIEQIKQNAVEQSLRIATQKAGLLKTSADTEAAKMAVQQMAANIRKTYGDNARAWQQMGINEQEMWIKKQFAESQKLQTEFNTSTPQQIKQWTEIVTDIIKAGAYTGF